MEAFMRVASHCWLAAGDHDALERTCDRVIEMYTVLDAPLRRGLARTNKAIALRMGPARTGAYHSRAHSKSLAVQRLDMPPTRMHLGLVLPKADGPEDYAASEGSRGAFGRWFCGPAPRRYCLGTPHAGWISWAGAIGCTRGLGESQAVPRAQTGADLNIAIQMLERHSKR